MSTKRAATAHKVMDNLRPSWNYRVVRTLWPNAVSYEIHEAYYGENGKCRAITQHHSSPFGNTPAEIARDILLMHRATELPPIDRDTLEELPDASS